MKLLEEIFFHKVNVDLLHKKVKELKNKHKPVECKKTKKPSK